MSPYATFEEWYQSDYPRLLTAITVLTSNTDLAAEVTDEACARCLVRWDTGDLADPSAWTYRVAANLVKRRWRSVANERKALEQLQVNGVVTNPELALELWEAVATLPLRARTAIVFRYVAGMTEAEVANTMRISPGAVAAMLSKARRRLAAMLDEQDHKDHSKGIQDVTRQ
jgi:RNA polymerase sigma factor (sigma-70 family)